MPVEGGTPARGFLVETGEKPDLTILRPMNLGEILDRAFEIYRKRLWLFVGVGVLPATMMLALRSADLAWVQTSNLVGRFSDGEVTRGGYIAWSWLVSYGYSHISGFLSLLFLPAFLRLTWCELFGESTTIVASLRFAQGRWRSYLWLAALVIAAVLIVPEVLAFGALYAAVTLEDNLGLFNPPSVSAVVAALVPIPGGLALILWTNACLALSIPAAATRESDWIQGLTAELEPHEGQPGKNRHCLDRNHSVLLGSRIGSGIRPQLDGLFSLLLGAFPLARSASHFRSNARSLRNDWGIRLPLLRYRYRSPLLRPARAQGRLRPRGHDASRGIGQTRTQSCRIPGT